MKSFIFFLLAVATCMSVVAQQTKDGKDVPWKRIAADTSITFQEVVTICDSLFANSPVVDTGEDDISILIAFYPAIAILYVGQSEGKNR